jgi:hypothetical protein
MTTRSNSLCASVLVAIALLTGCSVTFEARKVEPNGTAPPGVVYQLPMTRVDAVIPGALKTGGGGELAKLDEGYAACLLDPAAEFVVATPKPATLKLDLPRLSFAQVPDPSQIYSIEVKTGAFLTMSHSLTNNDQGFVGGVNSQGENRTGEAVVALAKTFVGLSSRVGATAVTALGVAPDQANLIPQGARPCQYCSAATAGLDTLLAALDSTLKGGETLGCKDVLLLHGLIAVEERKVQLARGELRNKLAQWVGLGAGQGLLVSALIEQNEKHIKTLADGVETLQKGLHVLPLDLIKQSVLLRLPGGFVPREGGGVSSVGASGTCRVQGDTSRGAKPPLRDARDTCTILLKQFSVEAPGANDPGAIKDILDTLLQGGQQLVISATPMAQTGPNGPRGTEPAEGGYRYRLPARGLLQAWLVDAGRESMQVSQEEPIAQYGPLVALPSKFSGMGAKVGLQFTQWGTMKSVELGQTAQDPSKVAESFKGLVDAVRAKPQAPDTVAGLEQSLKQQRLELCLKALATTSASSESLPAVCAGL